VRNPTEKLDIAKSNPQSLDRAANKLQRGRVTVPGEKDMSDKVLEVAAKWGADAIRDSDGTRLDDAFLRSGYEIYSTICLVRADQKFAQKNPRYQAGKYLMSEPVTATSECVEIRPLSGYFNRKYRINKDEDPKRCWEVIDRTTGDVVSSDNWNFDVKKEIVIIRNASLFHVYTVNFLVYQTWDSTSMYNHLTNNWKIDPIVSIDPYSPAVREHLYSFFDDWMKDHSHTDVVRLTTLAYHFTLDSDEQGKDKYRDWLGYTDCINVQLLEDFAREKGYRLRPEDIVDKGYYNATCRVPSERYLDWMDFIQHFVVKFGKELVSRIHNAGKKAAIFWGDHWIGAEFYSPLFQEMGIDINIGACESGLALRRLSDTPGPQQKEIRLYPYMFPDVFNEKGNPIGESQTNWVKIRRALLRKQVDRIGYGGYISLAMKHAGFIDHAAGICSEFREIMEKIGNTKPHTAPITVAVLDAWGVLRSWISHTGPDDKFKCIRPDTFEVAGSNLLECLSGLPVEVRFISFDDIIKENGVPSGIDVIINDGTVGTAWSGGCHWKDARIVAALRKWVDSGGGFIGATDPSACEYQGRYFQLADILGVEKEAGSSNGFSMIPVSKVLGHFITADLDTHFDTGVDKNYVYLCSKQAQLLEAAVDGHVKLAVNNYGSGRSVYMAALPYSCQNSRLLMRAIFWAANKENFLFNWFSSNLALDCAAYPETGNIALANCSDKAQTTTVYNASKQICEVSVGPYEIKWLNMKKI
jgi:1,3-beta-galactosyl-N-acetylhexosamine phosphorylase